MSMSSTAGVAGNRQRTRTVKIAFLATSSITPDASWLECYGACVGAAEGGQAGGQTYNNAAGFAGRGGHGGGYTEGPVPFVVGVPLSITVGVGGNGGAGIFSAANPPPTPALGTAGGTSSIGTALSATGGSNSGPGQGVGGLINTKGGPGGAGASSTNNGNAHYASCGAGGGSAASPLGDGYRGGNAIAVFSTSTFNYPATGGGTGGVGAISGVSAQRGGKCVVSATPPLLTLFDTIDPRFAYSAALPTVAAPQPGWGGGHEPAGSGNGGTPYAAPIFGGGMGGDNGGGYAGSDGLAGGLGGGGGGGAGTGTSAAASSPGRNGGKGGGGIVILEITLSA